MTPIDGVYDVHFESFPETIRLYELVAQQGLYYVVSCVWHKTCDDRFSAQMTLRRHQYRILIELIASYFWLRIS